MVIFGWGHQSLWSVGYVFKQTCGNCHNDGLWTLLRRTTWFTLFFIPVIPYKTEWWILCPTCQQGIELDSDQLAQLRPIAEANQMLSLGALSEKEHGERIRALVGAGEVLTSVQATPVEAVVVEDAAEMNDTAVTALARASYCGDCGKALAPDSNFCTGCGSRITSLTNTS